MASQGAWFYWALMSAACAALTAIFAKLGIQAIDSDMATLIRTAVVIVALWGVAALWLNRDRLPLVGAARASG